MAHGFIGPFIHKPTLESYWSKDPLLLSPAFPSLMTRDRFLLVLKFFHFNDNSQQPSGDLERRKFMASPIVDLLNKRCQEVDAPDQNISMDESLLKWLGNLSWKIFIPAKKGQIWNETLQSVPRGIHTSIVGVLRKGRHGLLSSFTFLYFKPIEGQTIKKDEHLLREYGMGSVEKTRTLVIINSSTFWTATSVKFC